MKISDYNQIPFYGNTPDNTHCYQAGIKMILGYYFPEDHYTWEMLEEITGKKPGKWTWPMKGWLYLAERGLQVSYYGTFDYEKFIADGPAYLLRRYGKEVGTAQIENSDIPYEQTVSRELIHTFTQVKRIPTVEDISDFIAQDNLILCNVNYYPLYGKPGYTGHFVVIYGIDDHYVYLQDPGLPPNPHARITRTNFLRAWNYSKKENRGLTVINRRMK